MWHYNYPPELKHYANPYYDPKKAHEYYEQHKQLKGRTSTSSLNEAGREIAARIKEQINTQRDTQLDAETEAHAKDREARQEKKTKTLEQHKTIMHQRISTLQNLLKRMPPAQKEAEAPKFRAIVQKLQEDNDKKRAEVEAKFKDEQWKADAESGYKKIGIRYEASDAYNDVLSSVAGDSRYAKGTSSRKRQR